MIEHDFYSGQTRIDERGGVSHGDKMSLTQSKQSWRLLVDSNERVCDCGEVQLFVVPRQFIQQVAWQSTIDHLRSLFFHRSRRWRRFVLPQRHRHAPQERGKKSQSRSEISNCVWLNRADRMVFLTSLYRIVSYCFVKNYCVSETRRNCKKTVDHVYGLG